MGALVYVEDFNPVCYIFCVEFFELFLSIQFYTPTVFNVEPTPYFEFDTNFVLFGKGKTSFESRVAEFTLKRHGSNALSPVIPPLRVPSLLCTLHDRELKWLP